MQETLTENIQTTDKDTGFLSQCEYISEMKPSVLIYCAINVMPYVYLLIYAFFLHFFQFLIDFFFF